MALLIRKSVAFLASKNKSSYVCRSPYVNFSLCIRFLSVSPAREPSTLSELLLDKHQFSPNVASHICSALARRKSVENPDLVITFLKNSGFSIAQLEKILKYRPRLLSADVERSIKPKLKICQELGFSSAETAQLISYSPVILHMDVDKKVAPALSMLKDVLGSNHDVTYMVKRSRGFLVGGSTMNLVPNIEYLKSYGVPMERIRKLLHIGPRILLLKPERLRKYMERAEKMGVDRSSNMFVHAVKIVGSMSNKVWELKVEHLRNLGFSDKDLHGVFCKAPSVLSLSIEKTKRTKDLLLSTGKFTMPCIIRFPLSLCSSIERKFLPRLRIFEILEEKNLIQGWPSLGTLFTLTNKQFARRYVIPYQDKIGESTWLKILSGEKV